ncbi:Predicted phospholipase, patatin/cPLA2 family [Salinibacillus kushneri]|uniref:Predicted phospholipase, patatin/cPLA2 family n=1 Tax=Salinibacillus kushneri TaxID=237682 RepID=A0A1I0DQY6_9BACI|nr:patatin family protein [Salinibacillus kushneri]SET34153.1 Predicted phospholipase, patatin/cPLA2 family [Salinibacillus kushneri]
MDNVGLVLEGGGMRGVFTGGVLHYLMEQNVYLPYVIGVSAGACNGSSYVAKQIERNRTVNIDYINHPEYISYKRFFKSGELFGMDFIFNKLPNQLVPFDYETFNQAPEEFVVGTTDCHTGEPVYYDKTSYKKDMLTILRASSSLPFMAPEIEFEGRCLLDGGIADPIPIKKSEQDGNRKNVVVLTRNKEYRKNRVKYKWLLKRKYGHYDGLIEAVMNRHEKYNQTLDYLEEQEKKGNVLIIRPEDKLDVGRAERNPEKLQKLYNQGYEQARFSFGRLKKFISPTSTTIEV